MVSLKLDKKMKYLVGSIAVILVVAIALIYISIPQKGSQNGYTNDMNTGTNQRITQACNFTEPPGKLINYLFDNHNLFKYKYYEYPQNKTIVWIINGPKSALDYLEGHIHQMECIIENGGTPRPNDPVFKVDAKITKDYVKTIVIRLNDTTLEIKKIAENSCAYEVIKLHAQIVKGFFETGRIEAQKIHEVPTEVLEVCKNYIS